MIDINSGLMKHSWENCDKDSCITLSILDMKKSSKILSLFFNYLSDKNNWYIIWK